jgi:hypothetical protein
LLLKATSFDPAMESSSGNEQELEKWNVHRSALRDPIWFTLVVVHTDFIIWAMDLFVKLYISK